MEERLQFILGSTNDWLKFAEAKNASLIVIDSAIAFAGIDRLTSATAPSCLARIYLIFAALALAVSALLSLISFLPRTRLGALKAQREPLPNDNLVFFEHIAAYSPSTYVTAIYARAGSVSAGTIALEQDYAAQIIANSRITRRKNMLFGAAAWTTVAALFTPLTAVILYFLLRTRQAVQ